MSIAQKFVDFLKEGKINEAIESIQGGLKDSSVEAVVEKRQELLESYGFSLQEKEDSEKEEEKTKKRRAIKKRRQRGLRKRGRRG